MLLKYVDETALAADEKRYLDLFRNWNLRNDPGEQGATIFRCWFDALEDTVWSDEYGQTKLPLMWPHESTLVEALLRDSLYRFVDNSKTPERETPRMMITAALKTAATVLKKSEAEGKLAWSKYKDSGVPHLLKLPALGKLHLTTGGGEHVINATKQYHGPSWRMVVHLTTPVEAYGIYPGGQSGNPGSKYYDNFTEDWAAGKYYKLWMMTEAEKDDKRVMAVLHFSN
jgi:penicillin amidase